MEIHVLHDIEPSSICCVGCHIVYIKDDIIQCVGIKREYPLSRLFPIDRNHFIEVSPEGSCLYDIHKRIRVCYLNAGEYAIAFGTRTLYIAVVGYGKLHIYTIEKHIMTVDIDTIHIAKGCEMNELIVSTNTGVYSYQLVDIPSHTSSTPKYSIMINTIYITPMLTCVGPGNSIISYPISEGDDIYYGTGCHLDYEPESDDTTTTTTETLTIEPTTPKIYRSSITTHTPKHDTLHTTHSTPTLPTPTFHSPDRRLSNINCEHKLLFDTTAGMIPYGHFSWENDDTAYITDGQYLQKISMKYKHEYATIMFKVRTGTLRIFNNSNKIFWILP